MPGRPIPSGEPPSQPLSPRPHLNQMPLPPTVEQHSWLVIARQRPRKGGPPQAAPAHRAASDGCRGRAPQDKLEWAVFGSGFRNNLSRGAAQTSPSDPTRAKSWTIFAAKVRKHRCTAAHATRDLCTPAQVSSSPVRRVCRNCSLRATGAFKMAEVKGAPNWASVCPSDRLPTGAVPNRKNAVQVILTAAPLLVRTSQKFRAIATSLDADTSVHRAAPIQQRAHNPELPPVSNWGQISAL